MRDRLENVTGINVSLQKQILKEYKPDEKAIHYFRDRLSQLNGKYQSATIDCNEQSTPAVVSRKNHNQQRILSSKARRLLRNPASFYSNDKGIASELAQI